MIPQWTARQVHDTVAAIAAGPAYGGNRESLIGRFLRFVIREINDFLNWMRGSLDARIIIYVALVVVLAAVIGRITIERRAADRRRRGLSNRGTRRDRRDQWQVAADLAAEKRFIDASHALYAAVLERLTNAQLVRFHASKTNGDYARELRRNGSAIAHDFLAFGRDFDRTVFGHTQPTSSDYERLLNGAEQMMRRLQQRAA